MQFRLIALHGHRQSNLLLGINSLIALDMDIEVVSTIYQFLTIILQSHLLAFVRTNLAADWLRVEHLTPVWVLADGLYCPCELISYCLEAGALEHLTQLSPGCTVVRAIEAVLGNIGSVSLACSQWVLGAGRELSHYPEAGTRSKVNLLFQGDIIFVCPEGIVYLLNQTCSRDRTRSVVNLNHRILSVLSLEAKIGQVETIRISCLIYIEILSQGIRQLGISFTDIAVQLVGIGQSVWPVLCLIVGSSHSVVLHKCWADCTAERKNLTRVRILDATAGRHGSSGCSSSKLILQHTLTGILHIERSLGGRSLGGIYCHKKVLLVYLNLRTCIGGSLLDGRYFRSLTPTVVSHNGEVVLGGSLQTFYLVRHLVA